MLDTYKMGKFNAFYRKGTFDSFIFNEIYNRKVYDNYLAFVSNPKVIIDLGANIGVFTLYVAQKHKDCFVYAFEPMPPSYNILQTNVLANKLRNRTKLYQFAVTDFNGVRYMNIQLWNVGGSGIVPNEKELEIKNLVPVATLDYESFMKLLPKEIDVMKIDVEGSERYMVSQLNKELIRRVKVYLIEVHYEEDSATFKKLVALFRTYGYDVTYTKHVNKICYLTANRKKNK